jgi:hypothetical protein
MLLVPAYTLGKRSLVRMPAEGDSVSLVWLV